MASISIQKYILQIDGGLIPVTLCGTLKIAADADQFIMTKLQDTSFRTKYRNFLSQALENDDLCLKMISKLLSSS